MPQMAPTIWISLMFNSMLVMMVIILMVFFFKKTHSTFYSKNYFKKNKNWSW